jgi:flagellar biogenesis protein FliO
VVDIQQALAVVAVLIALVTSLFVLRSKGIVRFAIQGKLASSNARRMQAIERLPLTAQHSLHLVKVAGRELLIAVSPSGCSVLDGPTRGMSTDDEGLLR